MRLSRHVLKRNKTFCKCMVINDLTSSDWRAWVFIGFIILLIVYLVKTGQLSIIVGDAKALLAGGV